MCDRCMITLFQSYFIQTIGVLKLLKINNKASFSIDYFCCNRF